MAKEAIATGTTSFKDMVAYGKKYTIRIVFSTILLSLIQSVSIIFWLPLYFAYKNAGYTIEMIFEMFYAVETAPDAFLSFLGAVLFSSMIGLLLTLIYWIFLSFIFYFVSYAIIVDDMPVIAAFKKSFALLRQYPWKVFFFIVLIILLTMALMIILSIVTMPFSMPSSLSPNVSLYLYLSFIGSLIQTIFSAAISVAIIVWNTRFYMGITENMEENLLDF